MISQKTIKTLSLALLSAGLLASCSSSSSSKATEEQSADTVRLVEVATAEMRALNLSEEFTAQLEAKVVNNITAQAGGRLKQLLVKVGDRVGAGQAVARMEATQASQAQIQLADAKTNFARMDELYKVGGGSKAQWEQAKSAVEQAKLILDSRLIDPPTYPELARMACLSESKLSRAFKQAYGVTIHAYVISCRLEWARTLIEIGKMSVAQAAATVGYANPSHFSQAFKERYGVSPSSI